jgi:methyltransferase (TIGR00027 family)
MREGEASRTAFGAAAHRAAHQDDEPRIFTDPLARRILGDVELPERAESRPRLRLFIAVRHRFAEDSLAAAVARGTRQVVVLGAGLDTFAYRNPFRETAVFEVDHPATGAWKRERVADSGIAVPDNLRYVAVDFETDSLGDRLREAGFDATAAAFFLWLGVVPYLTRDAVEETLRFVASVPGGEVVFDYSNPIDDAAAAPERAELRAKVAGLGEPFSDGLDTEELHALLRDLGFDEIEDLGRRAIRERYLGLPPGDEDGDTHVVRARTSRR